MLFLIIAPVYAWGLIDSKIDSLERLLIRTPNDSQKIEILTDLCWSYRNSNPQKAIKYGIEAIKKAEEFFDYENLVKVHGFVGVAYRVLGNYSKSTDHYFMGLELSQKYNLKEQQGYAFINIANLHIYQEYFNTAIDNLNRAQKIAEELNHSRMLSYVYLNYGRAKLNQSDYQSALSDFIKATEIRKQIDFKEGLPVCYKYLGDVYFKIGNLNMAIESYNKALLLVDKQVDRDLHANILVKIAELQLKRKSWNQAKENANRAIDIAKIVGSRLTIRDALNTKYQVDLVEQKYASAVNHLVSIIQYNDTLFSQQLSEKLFFLEYQYEKQKKESQIELLNKEKTIKELSLQRANTFNAALLIILLLITIIIIFLLSILKQRKEKNTQLENQNIEIAKQRENIENKNKNLEEAYSVIEGYIGKMTDSIQYAKRIQDALLPSLSAAQKYFAESYIFYKPKDFVSGDFYWVAPRNDLIYFAVADCTGHGVPGAFMSIIGLDLLNQAISNPEIVETNQIMEFINAELPQKLHLEKEELVLKDSMDIALCSVDFSSLTLKYCGALIPFILVRDKKVIELKSDFASVGTSKKLFKKPFTQQTLQLKAGDWIYLFSDGFMDQIGGDLKKKFMRGKFIETLVKLSSKPGNTQREELNQIFSQWKGNNEQIDDVLILGLKV
ncbi:MAG TPA: tetratricopeptide repeat protein [Tenuifilaceae bacterium]|nr:tetratricopeptide repeat protein [Tenuifilaceae bacterium]